MPTNIHGFGPNGELSPGAEAALDGLGGGGGASALDDLTDVDTTGQTTGDVLKYNGTNWVADAASAGTVTSTDISDSTAVGRDVLTAADAATARTAIGAGTSSFDGAYSSLSGAPTLGTAAAADAGDFATAAQGSTADTAVQPGDLAAVATTGDYDDLTDKPTLGTAASAATTDFAPASGQFPVNVVAISGATETLPATHAAHRVTMDQNCTFTFASPAAGHAFVLHLSGAFTPTWPASVDWAGGSAPTYDGGGTLYHFVTLDAGTTWLGSGQAHS